ncbi:unnamed protein product [Trichobilharzia regenti]|nr:unnamed protein product [Trichobilharzia regenti]
MKFRFSSLVTYSNESLERYKMSTNYSFTYKVNFEVRPSVTGGKYLLVSHVSKNGDVQFSVSIENGYVVYRLVRKLSILICIQYFSSTLVPVIKRLNYYKRHADDKFITRDLENTWKVFYDERVAVQFRFGKEEGGEMSCFGMLLIRRADKSKKASVYRKSIRTGHFTETSSLILLPRFVALNMTSSLMMFTIQNLWQLLFNRRCHIFINYARFLLFTLKAYCNLFYIFNIYKYIFNNRSLTITRTNSEPYRKEEIQEVKHFSFLNKDQWYYISFGMSDDRKNFLSVDGIKEDSVYMKVSFTSFSSFLLKVYTISVKMYMVKKRYSN